MFLPVRSWLLVFSKIFHSMSHVGPVGFGVQVYFPRIVCVDRLDVIVTDQIKSNQVYCHILQEEVYMSLTIH